MRKQRVTKNLGYNRSIHKEIIYKFIEKKFGPTKFCCRGRSDKKNQYNTVHVGENPLPIRNFNLQDARLDGGKFFVGRGGGLQAYCIPCERAYRKGRSNKCAAIFKGMSDSEIRSYYRTNYGDKISCSICKRVKTPEDFAISRNMERGLHNTCLICSKSYSESVGNRWVIYSPDGNSGSYLRGEKCSTCGSVVNLHKDHVWPIAKGGTDNIENIQYLCGPHNLSKSDSIVGISSIEEVDEKMICTRYHLLLRKAKIGKWSIQKFESEISREVRSFILKKSNMSDIELTNHFEEIKKVNNRKHSIGRAVKKFREYARAAVLDLEKVINSV